MSYRSSRSRSRSQTPVKVRQNGQNKNQNCKVYVSNIHRDAREEEIRELFQKFGLITYFELKRKPGDIIYAFLEYKSPDAAGEAVQKMNRTNFLDRTLNVQFGKGGKHQQKHYETIQIQPSRSREHSEMERSIPTEKYPRRAQGPQYQRREKRDSRIYAIGNNERRGGYRKSISPPIQLSYRHKKWYKEESPQIVQFDPKHQHRRQENRRYPNTRHPDADIQRRGQRRPINYSPRGERRPYQERRYQQTDRYEERRICDERRRLLEERRRQPEESRRPERYRNQSHERRDKGRNYEQRRKSDPRQETDRDRIREQKPYKRQRYERQSSPQSRRHGRTNKEDERKTNRYNDDRHRYEEHHHRGGYDRERQERRSRSRQKSPHKHKSHRYQRERYQSQQYRRQRQSRNYERQRIERQLRKEERRRHSPSDSPRRQSPQKAYRSPRMSIGYPKDSYRQYGRDQQRPQTHFRNQQTNRNSLSQKGKRSEGVETYRKSSRMSQDSRSVSPQNRPKEREPVSERKFSFSSEKEKSLEFKVKNETKTQNQIA